MSPVRVWEEPPKTPKSLAVHDRQGFVIFVPKGDDSDQTRPSSFYDETFMYLKQCGLKEVSVSSSRVESENSLEKLGVPSSEPSVKKTEAL